MWPITNERKRSAMSHPLKLALSVHGKLGQQHHHFAFSPSHQLPRHSHLPRICLHPGSVLNGALVENYLVDTNAINEVVGLTRSHARPEINAWLTGVPQRTDGNIRKMLLTKGMKAPAELPRTSATRLVMTVESRPLVSADADILSGISIGMPQAT